MGEGAGKGKMQLTKKQEQAIRSALSVLDFKIAEGDIVWVDCAEELRNMVNCPLCGGAADKSDICSHGFHAQK